MPKHSPAIIHKGNSRTLARLARVLRKGELVAIPTETVYGLAGDALNPKACRAIFRAKGRPSNDPLIVHIASLAQLDELAERNWAVDRIAHAFWPGPLTLVLPKKNTVPDIVTSGRPSVAVRMPRHILFRKLLESCGLPLAAPSANPFGYVSPTTAQHVQDHLGKKIRHILDGGPCEIGLESTILDLRDPEKPVILRRGAIDGKAIKRVLKRPVRESKNPSGRRTAALAPGMLSKHYSPRTPVVLHAKLSDHFVKHLSEDEAALKIFPMRKNLRAKNVFSLTTSSSLEQAGQALFAKLRDLDKGPWKKLHVELAPGNTALALAINDRLTRAAARR